MKGPYDALFIYIHYFIYPRILEQLVQLIPPNVNFCKDHRDKTEVPDPLAVRDPFSSPWPFSHLLAGGALARESKGSGDIGFLNYFEYFDWLLKTKKS